MAETSSFLSHVLSFSKIRNHSEFWFFQKPRDSCMISKRFFPVYKNRPKEDIIPTFSQKGVWGVFTGEAPFESGKRGKDAEKRGFGVVVGNDTWKGYWWRKMCSLLHQSNALFFFVSKAFEYLVCLRMILGEYLFYFYSDGIIKAIRPRRKSGVKLENGICPAFFVFWKNIGGMMFRSCRTSWRRQSKYWSIPLRSGRAGVQNTAWKSCLSNCPWWI